MKWISEITIIGAQENNLKSIDLRIPKNKLVVLTGVSGSGKSTIAFNTLQKECRRQYMESLGFHAEHISKPKVKSITGLSPAISVDQNNTNRNPRSTVGTITEILTNLRLLYAKIGVLKCPKCGTQIRGLLPNINELDTIQECDEVEDDYSDDTDLITCPVCKKQIKALTISDFSFNKPVGACPRCGGLGYVSEIKIDKIIKPELTIAQGAITYWSESEKKMYTEVIQRAADYYGFEFDENAPLCNMHEAAREIICFGVDSPKLLRLFPQPPPSNIAYGRYIGAVPYMQRRLTQQRDDERYKKQKEEYMAQEICPDCLGSRLNEHARSVLLNGKSIDELCNMSINQLFFTVKSLAENLSHTEQVIFNSVFDTIYERLKNMIDLGLGYLTLNRSTPTLSAGEYQRLRLASLLGSGLTGVLYVLDEPTVGLHQCDTAKLIKILSMLRDMGNTILVIEHDVEFMKAADYIIDIGPGGGKNGGRVVACGTLDEIIKSEESLTARYLKEDFSAVRTQHRKGNGYELTVLNASENNLKNINALIPLGKFIALTGVSGAGKSTLLFQIIARAAQNRFNNSHTIPGKYQDILGWEHIDSVITIDQTPMGRIARSNVMTYTDIFKAIRDLYAQLPDAKQHGYEADFFSFNLPQGRCKRCEGQGTITVNMSYQEPIEVRCPVCKGKRYKKEILEIKYKDKSISDIFDLTIDEALSLFQDKASIRSKLQSLSKVGVGYLRLGQGSLHLSGGEVQRIKLSKELEKHKKGHVLYLLDEPTKGLHPYDVEKLLIILNELVDRGNTVIAVEHNIELIKAADYLIDMGPGGGSDGGRILACGTLDDIMQCEQSITGKYFKKRFENEK